MGNKGKRGKARKARKAAKAAKEANSKETADYGPQRQDELYRRKCCHIKGGLSWDSPEMKLCTSFAATFSDCIFEMMERLEKPGLSMIRLFFEVAKDRTWDYFVQVWKNPVMISTVNSIFINGGTTQSLKQVTRNTRIGASIVRFLEEYTAVELLQHRPLINWPKICESYMADPHTLIKFWRHRNQCSCLDDKYQQVKHITKTGICFNAQCPNIFDVFQVGYVPRSKTKYCSRCRNVTYCSRECQVADWSEHKSACDHNAEIISKFKVT